MEGIAISEQCNTISDSWNFFKFLIYLSRQPFYSYILNNILSASTKNDKLASKRKEHRHKSEIFDRKRENDVSKMRTYEIKMIILKNKWGINESEVLWDKRKWGLNTTTTQMMNMMRVW